LTLTPCPIGWRSADKTGVRVLARVLSRDRWSIFLVKPDTILGWHRRLVAKH
jgi:hypothetical protein